MSFCSSYFDREPPRGAWRMHQRRRGTKPKKSSAHIVTYSYSNSSRRTEKQVMEDSSSVATTRTARQLPGLAFQELSIGRLVGQGGFSLVSEVRNVQLDDLYDTGEKESNLRRSIASLINGGESRYVIKILRTDLPEDEAAKGIVDLAIEAKFLATLTHPNIIAMRATANSDPLESKFFVILDRLETTLDRRMNYWRKVVGENMGFWMGPCIGYCCARTHALQRLWLERLMVCRDIASAIKYLHSQDLVYRDLKPDNVGFDANNVLKIFDFGLAKRLDPLDRTDNDLYLLTGNTGSLRYMAPEVALGLPYDLRVDSYSFGILFWQICALTTPYSGYSVKLHEEKVVRRGYRPKPDPSWPGGWVTLMKECWSGEIFDRPGFDYIVGTLDGEVADMMRHDGVAPGRVHAKNAKSKKKVDQRLDVDTRISTQQGEVQDNSTTKLHDANIV